MLKLILLRHAKTNQISDTGKDFDRALLPRGIAQGKDLQVYFQLGKTVINEIHVSSSKRTTETFELVKSAFSNASVLFLESLYLVDSHELFRYITQHFKADNCLLIGHNFGISDLASYLTDKDIVLRTGELVEIDFEADSWKDISKGTGTITVIYRPEI